MNHFDNDMDEMFFKAGQNYPLNTDRKDWDAVARGLQSAETPSTPQKGNSYFRYLPLLLLLIPVAYLMFDNQPAEKLKVTSSPVAETNSKETTSLKNIQEKEHSIRPNSGMGVNRDDVKTGNVNADKNVTDSKETRSTAGHSLNNLRPRANDRLLPSSAGLKDLIKLKLNQNVRPALAEDIGVPVSLMRYSVPGMIMQSEKTVAPSSKILVSVTSFFPLPQPIHESNVSNEKRDKQARFYYGIVAGPDVSTIKNQRIEKMGYSAGIILGYQLNNRWSIEASGLWSNKKYYTDGKYFDKTKAHIPAYVTIYYLDGGCRMIEIPVAVRYSFSKTSSGFFATAGFNTYLMNQEDYNYKADAGTGVYEGYRTYDRSGNHLFSNLQLSGGYEFNIFNKTNIRIEPYLQVPVQKVGIGKMPITSAGVHLGLMRRVR